MTLEQFGQNVACNEILTDKEARYLLTLYSGVKPPQVLPFKTEKRAANFKLLEFPAQSISTVNCRNYGQTPACILDFSNLAACDIEISELQFCQTTDRETNDSVQIEGTAAKSVVKVGDQTFKGYPIYKASFEKAYRFSTQSRDTLCVYFQNTNSDFPYSLGTVAILQADTITHSFTINGKPITVSLQGYDNVSSWYCLLALKMRYVN